MNAFTERNLCQFITVAERIAVNEFDAVAYYYGFQINTALKCSDANVCYVVWNVNLR